MKREHVRVMGFAVVMVCAAAVKWGLGYVADHGVNGLGVAVSPGYDGARRLLFCGDVARVVSVGAACLCMMTAMRMTWERRERWWLWVVVVLVLSTMVFWMDEWVR